MQVKICGITSVEDGRAAAAAGADFVGLVLAPSPRQVSLATARDIVRVLPPSARVVLVFRNARLDEVMGLAAACGALWVQLHGREPVAYLHALQQQRPGLHVIKAWEVGSTTAADELTTYLATAARSQVQIDVVLLDAPKSGPHPGYERMGDLARRCAARPPLVWCAGGLTPENVRTALAVGLYDGADVASGVEAQPGVKDPDAVRRFVAAAKGRSAL